MPPKPFPTHFLCIPLVNAVSRPQLTESLGAFAADVTSPTSYGIPPDAVRPVGTLHLTLGVMSFPKDEGLDRATDFLRSLKLQDILASVRKQVATRRLPGDSEDTVGDVGEQGCLPLKLTLRGLASMQSPSKTTVLYTPPVDGMGVLQAFCEQVRMAFMTAELMQDEGRPLLLHATIVNTIYVKNKKPKPVSGEGNREGEADGERKPRKGRWGKRAEKLVIDARGILDRYEDQVWMEGFDVDKIAICRMGAKKVMVDGVEDQAYEEVAEVGF